MRKLKIANSREYNIKMTYYLVTIQTIVCLTGVTFQIPKWRVPRLLKSEELSLTGQGLLRVIKLKTFRSVIGYSISIVNMSKQDDGSITGEILHRFELSICLQQSTNRFDRSSDIDTMIIKVQ